MVNRTRATGTVGSTADLAKEIPTASDSSAEWIAGGGGGDPAAEAAAVSDGRGPGPPFASR